MIRKEDEELKKAIALSLNDLGNFVNKKPKTSERIRGSRVIDVEYAWSHDDSDPNGSEDDNSDDYSNDDSDSDDDNDVDEPPKKKKKTGRKLECHLFHSIYLFSHY